MLITEQLPNIVHEQVNAISNLKIDKVTVWDGGKNADGKTGTADFLSGLISALPPLHELARNAGLDLPTYLGQLQREAEKSQAPMKSAGSNEPAAPKSKRETPASEKPQS
jgi:flotillin